MKSLSKLLYTNFQYFQYISVIDRQLIWVFIDKVFVIIAIYYECNIIIHLQSISQNVGLGICRRHMIPRLSDIQWFIHVHDMRTQHDHCSISILCFAMLAMPRSKKLREIFVQSFFLLSFSLFLSFCLVVWSGRCALTQETLCGMCINMPFRSVALWSLFLMDFAKTSFKIFQSTTYAGICLDLCTLHISACFARRTEV